jgi:nitroreductase
MTSAALNTAAAITNGRAPDAEIDEMFHERWSRRALSSRPLSPEQVRSLFEAARWAPSSSNQQPWLFVYNDDAETLARARPVLMEFNRRWADNAPLLIFVFARKRHPDTGEPLRSAQFDTGAAWFSIALQAHKLGLNTRAMGGIQHELAYDTFGVPREDFESIAAIAVGYPGERAELHASLIEREVPTTRRPASTFALKGQYRRE